MRFVALLVAAGCEHTPPNDPNDPPADAIAEETVEQIANGLDQPTALAVDSSHVYFAQHGGSIGRIPKAGGALTSVATGQAGPTSLDASTDRLCWVATGTHARDFTDGSVRCAAKSGGAEVELATSYFPSALAIDDAVYWVEIDGQRVRRIELDGSSSSTLEAAPTSKTSIAVSPSYIAWTASGTEADVVRMNRADRTQMILSNNEYAASAVQIDGDAVYWITVPSLSDNGAIRRWQDGQITDIVTDEYAPRYLIRSGGTFYWKSDGSIRRFDGTTATTVVANRGTLGGLVSDGEYLYWSEPDTGAIFRHRR